MTGETICDLLKPLIGKSGSISLLVSLNDSGVGRGQLLIVLCRFSAVVSGSYVPGGWRWRPVCPERAPAPTAPGWSPFRLRGRGGWSGGCG